MPGLVIQSGGKNAVAETRGIHRPGLVGGRIQPGDDERAGGRVTNHGGVIILELDGDVTDRERRRAVRR